MSLVRVQVGEFMTTLAQDYKEMLLSMTEDLNGEIHFSTTLDHSGRSSDKITIEYNVKQKESN